MIKQVSLGVEAREAIKRGIDIVADSVKITLGPKGRNAVLGRRGRSPVVTNDGVTIVREIELADEMENTGAQLIREAATKTNDQAGDGTTTATILAQALISEGFNLVAQGANPMQMKIGIEAAVEAVVSEIAKQSRPVSGHEGIAQIATISSQSSKIGELIGDAFDQVGRDGVISIEDSASSETKLEIVEGMQFDRGYISHFFVTHPEKMIAELDKPVILIADHQISSFQALVPLLEQIIKTGRPLLMIADDLTAETLHALVMNKMQGVVLVVAVKAPGFGDRRRPMLEDLAVLTGATIISQESGISLEKVTLQHLGQALRVTVTRDTTTIVGGSGPMADIQSRIAILRGQVEATESEWEKEQLQQRLAKLSGGVAVIRVGAATELEQKEKKHRIEDALSAARSALAEGIVAGGGTILAQAQSILNGDLGLTGDQAQGVRLVQKIMTSPLAQIAENCGKDPESVVAKVLAASAGVGYDALNDIYTDMIGEGVVDPAMVARASLQNAASVAAMVLTTEALVVDVKEDK